MQHTTRRPVRPRSAAAPRGRAVRAVPVRAVSARAVSVRAVSVRALAVGALAVGSVALGAAPALAAPAPIAPGIMSASITAPATATVGDVVDASVALTGTSAVYAYELVVDYDPAVLDYVDGSATAPDGGFDAVDEAEGTLTVTHTRLGTSPELAGDLAVGLQFAAIGAGDGTLGLASVTLVSSEGLTTTLAAPAAAPLAVTAAAVPPVDPAPVPAPDPSTPAGGGTAPVPSPTSGATSASSASSPLAFTGAEVLPGIIAGAAVLLAGVAAVVVAQLRRRRSAGTR
jgi:hypothetical protein